MKNNLLYLVLILIYIYVYNLYIIKILIYHILKKSSIRFDKYLLLFIFVIYIEKIFFVSSK